MFFKKGNNNENEVRPSFRVLKGIVKEDKIEVYFITSFNEDKVHYQSSLCRITLDIDQVTIISPVYIHRKEINSTIRYTKYTLSTQDYMSGLESTITDTEKEDLNSFIWFHSQEIFDLSTFNGCNIDERNLVFK